MKDDMKDMDSAWQKKIAEEKLEYAAAAKKYDEIMKEFKEKPMTAHNKLIVRCACREVPTSIHGPFFGVVTF